MCIRDRPRFAPLDAFSATVRLTVAGPLITGGLLTGALPDTTAAAVTALADRPVPWVSL